MPSSRHFRRGPERQQGEGMTPWRDMSGLGRSDRDIHLVNDQAHSSHDDYYDEEEIYNHHNNQRASQPNGFKDPEMHSSVNKGVESTDIESGSSRGAPELPYPSFHAIDYQPEPLVLSGLPRSLNDESGGQNGEGSGEYNSGMDLDSAPYSRFGDRASGFSIASASFVTGGGDPFNLPRRPLEMEEHLATQTPPADLPLGSPPSPHAVEFARAMSRFMSQSNFHNNISQNPQHQHQNENENENQSQNQHQNQQHQYSGCFCQHSSSSKIGPHGALITTAGLPNSLFPPEEPDGSGNQPLKKRASIVTLLLPLPLSQPSSPSSPGRASVAPSTPPFVPPPPPLPQPLERPDLSLLAEICFVLMICLAQVLMLAGIAQAMVPVFDIAKSFPGSTLGDMAWYSAAYGLTAGTFVLPSGRLGDVFGHKRVFIIGFLWFGLWSLLAGLSPIIQARTGAGTVYFCVCRGLQGIGPSLLVPNGQAMLGRNYAPGSRKNLVMCLFGAAAPFGFVLGAIFSSIFASRGLWGWSFHVLAIVCVIFGALSLVCIPPDAPRASGADAGSSGPLHRRLDIAGMLLGVSGLVLFNVAWNQVPIVTFAMPYTYFLMIIGLMLMVAFVYVESQAQYPLLPVSAMTASTSFVLGCTAAGWACFSIWIWYLVLFLQEQRHWSPLTVSAALVPSTITGLAASLLVGLLMYLGVKPHWIILTAMVAFTIGSVLVATAPVEQTYWSQTFVAVLIMPFGMDMSNPAATILVSNSVSREHQGIAASLVVTAVNYAISVSLGMAGTVERHIVDDGGDFLQACRGAQYFGVGVGGLGVLIAVAFLARSTAHGGKAAVSTKTG